MRVFTEEEIKNILRDFQHQVSLPALARKYSCTQVDIYNVLNVISNNKDHNTRNISDLKSLTAQIISEIAQDAEKKDPKIPETPFQVDATPRQNKTCFSTAQEEILMDLLIDRCAEISNQIDALKKEQQEIELMITKLNICQPDV